MRFVEVSGVHLSPEFCVPVLHVDAPKSDGLKHAWAFQRRRENSEPFLLPDIFYFSQSGYSELRRRLRESAVAWTARKPTFLWRGSTTGMVSAGIGGLDISGLSQLPRFRLCTLSATLKPHTDVGITSVVQAKSQEDAEEIHKFLEQSGLLAQPVPKLAMATYRFLLDIDGNANSWSFLEKLLMGSCVLKVESDWTQWYYDSLRAWVHYVPIAPDLSDLSEKVDWCLTNESACEVIAANGKRFADALQFDDEMRRLADRVIQCDLATRSQSVMTKWQTRLYRDPKTGQLAHGAFGAVPHNVTVRGAGDAAAMQWLDSGGRPAPPGPGEHVPVLRPLPGLDRYALVRNEQFLCAEPNGKIVLRPWLKEWEMFTLLRQANAQAVSGRQERVYRVRGDEAATVPSRALPDLVNLSEGKQRSRERILLVHSGREHFETVLALHENLMRNYDVDLWSNSTHRFKRKEVIDVLGIRVHSPERRYDVLLIVNGDKSAQDAQLPAEIQTLAEAVPTLRISHFCTETGPTVPHVLRLFPSSPFR
jgi:hypothetical protein